MVTQWLELSPALPASLVGVPGVESCHGSWWAAGSGTGAGLPASHGESHVQVPSLNFGLAQHCGGLQSETVGEDTSFPLCYSAFQV